MKFIWADDDKYPDQVPFLKNNYEIVEDNPDPDVTVYKIKKEDEHTNIRLKLLEEMGFIKIIKEINELQSVEDIIPMTKRVEKLKSSPMYLKIYFPNTSFLLSESELMTVTKFRKCLLREGKFISIPSKAWWGIVQYWLDVAEEIVEETEDDYVVDKVLNYLSNCIIYEDADKAISRNTLFYDNDEKGVVCSHIDAIVEFINNKRKNEISSRKLRAVLSDYVVGDSIRKRIFNNRYRFWMFDIAKSGVDLEKQLFVKEKSDEIGKIEVDHQKVLDEPKG